MPEQREQPSQSLSHAQALRQEAGRRLSRSPHPYHKQQFELPYSSERVSSKVSSTSSPLWSAQTTDDEEQESPRGLLEDYREGLNSESGTEADDEHFLKGLPAPKLRPHKGLRGGEGSLSSSPSPRLSPEIFDRNNTSAQRTLRRSLAAIAALNEEEARDVAARTTQKRKVEVVRRITEAGILVFVGGIICRNDGVRELLWIWKRGKLLALCILRNGANGRRNLMPECHHWSPYFIISLATDLSHKPNTALEKTSSNRSTCCV